MSSATESKNSNDSSLLNLLGIHKAGRAATLQSFANSLRTAQANSRRLLSKHGGIDPGEEVISVDSPITTTNHYHPQQKSALGDLSQLALSAGLGAGGLVAYEAWQASKAAAPVAPPAAVDTDTDTDTQYDFGIFRPPGEQAK